MLNKSGITTVKAAGPVQILANVELQSSVGCIVPEGIGVTVGGRKIARAGYPIKVDLSNLKTAAVGADDSTNAMNAVLLHDVDVTHGNANGTALIFGFVNLNRVDSTTQGKITTALSNANASKLVTFMKV